MQESFQLVYNAAIAQDEAALKTLITQGGVSLDVKKDFFTPAGLLAKEGNIKAAEWLRNQGADVNQIAFGAAAGNHSEYALQLNTLHGQPVKMETILVRPASESRSSSFYTINGQRPMHGPNAGRKVYRYYKTPALYREKRKNLEMVTIDWIAAGAAFGNHRELVETCRAKQNALLEPIVEWSLRGNHYDYINWLRQHTYELTGADFVRIAKINSADQILHALSHINSKILRDEIAKCFSKLPELPDLIKKAQTTRKTMARRRLTFDQALCFNNNEIKMCLSVFNQCAPIGPNKIRLPLDIIFKIMHFISDNKITLKDARIIYETLFDRYYRLPTIRRLNQYIDKRTSAFQRANYPDRALDLKNNIAGSTYTFNIANFLNSEISFFNYNRQNLIMGDQYYKIITEQQTKLNMTP